MGTEILMVQVETRGESLWVDLFCGVEALTCPILEERRLLGVRCWKRFYSLS